MLKKTIGVLLVAASANAASLEATSANAASYLPNIDPLFYKEKTWDHQSHKDLVNCEDVDSMPLDEFDNNDAI